MNNRNRCALNIRMCLIPRLALRMDSQGHPKPVLQPDPALPLPAGE